jgi:DNA-binding transcriptional ArsR family regulator
MSENGISVEKELLELKDRVKEMDMGLRHILALLQTSPPLSYPVDQTFLLLREEARERALTSLDAGMVKRCELRKDCRQKFADFLERNLELLDLPRIEEDNILSRMEELEALRSEAVPGRCDDCFNEVGTLFRQQRELMKALRLYRSHEEVRQSLDTLPEAEVVKELLEPLSNVQRLNIMKSLAKAPRSFSELSSITNLRGGNLLYHLQRLTATQMIVQRGGRGDYALSERGTRALEMVNDLYLRTLTTTTGIVDKDPTVVESSPPCP